MLTLSFPDLGLLIPLGHDVGQSGTNDGPLELLGPLGTLLGGLLLNTLLVLPPVEHSPCGLAGVALQKVGLVRPVVEESEHLQRNKKVFKSVFEYNMQRHLF